MSNLYKNTVNYSFMVILFAVAVFVPEQALATGVLDLCKVVGLLQGDVAQAVATVAVITLGIGAAIGRVSWNQAILVGIGIVVIFGVGPIVELAGGTAC